MTPIVKQRLVGAAVLLALAIVFWPIIFVQPTVDTPLRLSQAATPPEIDEAPLASPKSSRADIESVYVAPAVDPEQQADADLATALADDNAAEVTLSEGISDLPNAKEIDPAVTRSEPPEAVKLDTAGFVESWVLQVAAVKDRERALKLVAALKAKGYEAFTREVIRSKEALWRVQIGPKLERAKLVSIKARIDQSFGVNAAILRYEQ
jgi:DedD protein